MNKSILSWLNSTRNYQQGLILLNQYSSDPVLKILLESGNSSYHQKRLSEALESINQSISETANPKAALIPSLEDFPKQETKSLSDKEWDTMPEIIKDTMVKRNRLHSRSRHLFLSLRYLPTQEERITAGLQLLDDREEIQKCWARIDEYRKNGIVKQQEIKQEEKEIAELSISELIRLQHNLPTYICKAKTRLKKQKDGAQKAKTLLLIETHERKLNQVNERLKS
ncbi:hypothetical protein D3C80_1169180 [compost metagenome]